MLNGNVGYTPYEGMQLKGWPVETWSRGELVVKDGTVVAEAGRGRFLPCDPPQTAIPRGRPIVDPALFA